MAIQILQEGSFDSTIRNQINANFAQLMGITTGNIYYLDPWHGFDGNTGQYPTQAFKTLKQGYAVLRSGYNDTLVLIGSGNTSATARVSSTFTWAKDAAHLIGVSSGTRLSGRARITPNASDTAFANFFKVTGNGCLFSGIQWFHGFTSGVAAEICMTVTGSRNKFYNCALSGMGDTTGATDTGSRSLLLQTGGENEFVNCSIGLDTVVRTGANASVEFKSDTPRNIFENCVFPFQVGAGGAPLGVLGAAADCMDRFQLFKDCYFINGIDSTATTQTDLCTLPASAGGMLVFRNCTIVGITNYGHDATTRGQIWVDGGAPAADTTISQTGIAVAPAK